MGGSTKKTADDVVATHVVHHQVEDEKRERSDEHAGMRGIKMG